MFVANVFPAIVVDRSGTTRTCRGAHSPPVTRPSLHVSFHAGPGQINLHGRMSRVWKVDPGRLRYKDVRFQS